MTSFVVTVIEQTYSDISTFNRLKVIDFFVVNKY